MTRALVISKTWVAFSREGMLAAAGDEKSQDCQYLDGEHPRWWKRAGRLKD
jgi:hypothetical protein